MRNMDTLIVILLLWGGVLISDSTRAAFAEGETIADSEAQHSGTQGQDNWLYGYYDGDSETPYRPADFELLPTFRAPSWMIQNGPGGYWTSLHPEGGHPNGLQTCCGRRSAEHWPVRRYVSNVSGLITLQGEIEDLDSHTGNGINGWIFVDNTPVLMQTVKNTGITFELDVKVSLGSVIDFAIDPRDRHDMGDSTRYTTVLIAKHLDAFFVRGDPNADSLIDIADAVFLLTHLFVDGPSPSCMKTADVNASDTVNLADPIALLAFLFAFGPPPPAPFRECGLGSSGGELGCDIYAPCGS